MTKLTADTITVSQIRALRDEALAHGDSRQVDICDVALCADGPPAPRTEARGQCAAVIAYALAEAEDVQS